MTDTPKSTAEFDGKIMAWLSYELPKWNVDVKDWNAFQSGARCMFEQDQKVISELRVERLGHMNLVGALQEQLDKLQAELATAKEQLAWNLQNNDEFGCEFVGIVILKQQLGKANARILELEQHNGKHECGIVKAHERILHLRGALDVVAQSDSFYSTKQCDIAAEALAADDKAGEP